MASPLVRRTAGFLSALLLAAAAVVGLAGPAQAEDGFQYWHYSHLQDGAWAFAETGPADFTPEDGAVEGYRFGTSTMSQPIEPRADLEEVNFDTVCAGTEAAEGEKRVAIVLDYGTDDVDSEPPAPRAECAAVPEDASGQDVLGEVAEVRVEGGMTCALDGHPASGCGVPVADAEVPAEEETVAFELPADAEEEGTTDAGAETSAGNDLLWPLVGIGLVVVLIAAAALAMNRRSKTP